MSSTQPKKTSKFVVRCGDWSCKCTHINFHKDRKCRKCKESRSLGTIFTEENIPARRRRKAKKKPTRLAGAPTNVGEFLAAWSMSNPYGKNVRVTSLSGAWAESVLEAINPSSGAHIHTIESQWKFSKIHLGSNQPKRGAWLPISPMLQDELTAVAKICLSAALLEVANYADCKREQRLNGAVWTLPCCEAAEICSVIYQPHGATQQRLHKDGHMRYCLPNAPETLFNSFFLNVIVPLKGDIPTLFRGNDMQLHASTLLCNKNEIRIFNGGLWHAGARNNSGTGVWKLFLGLVPANHPSAGDFPIFADGGKSLAKQQDRCVLVADTR